MAPGILDSSTADAVIPAKTVEHLSVADGYGDYFPAEPARLKLESNFGPMHTESIGYLQPTSKDTPIEVMRERYERDGYLFVCRPT